MANCVDHKYDVRLTTASYPNFRAFVNGPEFCIVYNKLVKSCQSEKRITLQENYPDLCEHLVQNGTNCKVCSTKFLDDIQKIKKV